MATDLNQLSDAELEAIVSGGGAPATPDFSQMSESELEAIANQKPTSLVDVAKGTGTTIVKGLSHVPGMFGDIAQLGSVGSKYLLQKGKQAFTGQTPEQQDATAAAAEAAWNEKHPVLGKLTSFRQAISPENVLPTSGDIQQSIFKHTGEYVPTSPLGKVAMEAGDFGLSMLGPQGLVRGGERIVQQTPSILQRVVGAGRKLGEVGRDVALGTLGGTAAGTAGVLTDENPLYKIGAAAGAMLTPGALRAGWKTLAAKGQGTLPGVEAGLERSATQPELAAGKAFRAAAENPEQAIANLAASQDANAIRAAGDVGITHSAMEVPGTAPFLSQALTTNPTGAVSDANAVRIAAQGQAAELEARLAAEKAAREAQQATELAAQEEAARKAAEAISTNPDKAAASESARAISDAAYARDKAAEKALWETPELKDATLHAPTFVRDMFQSTKDLPFAHGEAAQDILNKELTRLVDKYPNLAPMEAAQSFRSDWLNMARAKRATDPREAAVYSHLADAAKTSIETRSLYRNGQAIDTTIPAWQAARDATRALHETHNTGFLGKLQKVDKTGMPAVLDAATLGTVLKPADKGGAQMFDMFVNKAGPEVAAPVTDYLMGHLTQNGRVTPTSAQLEKFMGDWGHIIDHPAMGDLRAKFSALSDATLAKEQGALAAKSATQQAEADARAATKEQGASVLNRFTNYDPAQAVKSVLTSKSPTASATELMHSVGNNEQAKWGVRAALLEHMDTAVGNDPAKFLDFYKKNNEALRRILGEGHQLKLLDEIAAFSQGAVKGDASYLNKLNNGSFLDVLLGARTGLAARAGLGFGTAKVAEAALGHDIGPLVELAGAGLGAASSKFVNALAMGGAKDAANAAIMRAFADPQYMRFLMQKATPTAWSNIHQSMAPVMTNVRLGAQGAEE